VVNAAGKIEVIRRRRAHQLLIVLAIALAPSFLSDATASNHGAQLRT
jgi:hypothetical protein